MGRTKQFNRNDVLQKALPLFWKKGLANTGLQELENVTGVNKSGLYSEFEDKNEIFLESLKLYLQMNVKKIDLLAKPLGWQNIVHLFSMITEGQSCNPDGCFMVNSYRELSQLPRAAQKIIVASRISIKDNIIQNLKAEKVSNSDFWADLTLTFFSGLSIEGNLKKDKKDIRKKIAVFIEMIQNSVVP